MVNRRLTAHMQVARIRVATSTASGRQSVARAITELSKLWGLLTWCTCGQRQHICHVDFPPQTFGSCRLACLWPRTFCSRQSTVDCRSIIESPSTRQPDSDHSTCTTAGLDLSVTPNPESRPKGRAPESNIKPIYLKVCSTIRPTRHDRPSSAIPQV